MNIQYGPLRTKVLRPPQYRLIPSTRPRRRTAAAWRWFFLYSPLVWIRRVNVKNIFSENFCEKNRLFYAESRMRHRRFRPVLSDVMAVCRQMPQGFIQFFSEFFLTRFLIYRLYSVSINIEKSIFVFRFRLRLSTAGEHIIPVTAGSGGGEYGRIENTGCAVPAEIAFRGEPSGGPCQLPLFGIAERRPTETVY